MATVKGRLRAICHTNRAERPAAKGLTGLLKGLGELKESRKKTPKQGSGRRRDRWIGDKGRKIYEWDSQHGELDGDRASDGSCQQRVKSGSSAT